MKIITIAAALAASAVLATPAMAAGPEVRTTRIKVTDEDFASSRTIARLESRIRRAARNVCLQPNGPNIQSRSERACVAKAIAGAQQERAAVQMRHGIAMGG